MQYARPTNDAQGAPKLHKFVFCLVERFAFGIALHVTKVSDVAYLFVGTTMSVTKRVVVGPCSNTTV